MSRKNRKPDELVALARRTEDIRRPLPVRLTATSLDMEPGASVEAWREVGAALGRFQDASHWWVGDWLLARQENGAVPSAVYDQAERVAHYARHSLHVLAFVASQFARSRRIEARWGPPDTEHPGGITWGHHQVLAASLTPAEQDGWLQEAVKNRWSVRDLREALRRRREGTPPFPTDKYRCLVIDPPWPMEKSERAVHPEQGSFLTFRPMSLEEIAAVEIPAIADTVRGCHVYLWVTHRFLSDGLDILAKWGVTYHCEMTWVKPSGMTPFSWMLNTEHCLFGYIGPFYMERMGQKVSFEAPVLRHSEKPDAFYDLVRAASAEPRRDLYQRRPRPGFLPWGAGVEGMVDVAKD